MCTASCVLLFVCLFFPQDLKPSNVLVKEDCSLKVCYGYACTHMYTHTSHNFPRTCGGRELWNEANAYSVYTQNDCTPTHICIVITPCRATMKKLQMAHAKEATHAFLAQILSPLFFPRLRDKIWVRKAWVRG